MVAISTLIICAAGQLATPAQGPRGARPNAVVLDPTARAALLTALAGPEGEYAAHAEYTAILAKFGSTVLPYANILKSEKQHIAALQQQCVKFGVPVPADTYLGKVTAPATLLEAAQVGVFAENLNVAMYDTLLTQVAKYPSLVQVLTNLRAASLNNHLPAFEKAVANGGVCTNPGTCTGTGTGSGTGTCTSNGGPLRDGSCGR